MHPALKNIPGIPLARLGTGIFLNDQLTIVKETTLNSHPLGCLDYALNDLVAMDLYKCLLNDSASQLVVTLAVWIPTI